MAITYAWSEPTGDVERPVRGFVIGTGDTTADLPTQLVKKPVADIMVASGVVEVLAGTGSIALDRDTGASYRLESDGAWH